MAGPEGKYDAMAGEIWAVWQRYSAETAPS